ncbi:MAG: zf-HC2 domain-containing protein [Acidobacteria bacterium]|nr:zf-HC2 domain-containing protein [Acidobacteriota bacterium]
MPELAPIETRPPQGSCPSAEDLACYVDGALSPEEAARVTAHLASCESCFEVYSEVLQFQLESEPPAGKVVPFPGEKRRPAVPWWSSLAAVLVVGLVGVYFYLLAPPPTLVTAKLASPLQGRAGLAKDRWRPATRGGGEGEEKDRRLREVAFRLGVQAVNLRASLLAGDRETAVDVLAYILGALQGQLFVQDLEKSFGDMQSALLQGKPPAELAAEADRLSQDARELDPLYFDLGQWVEAGRLAAISHDPAFFRLPETRSFLRHVLWRDRLGIGDSKLPQKGRREFDAIGKILDQSQLKPGDFDEMRDHFKNILDDNYHE